MHPYRLPCPPPPEPHDADEDGTRLSFRVLTFVGAVQVVAALAHPGPPCGQTLFGAACFIWGLTWLVRHRRPWSDGPAQASRVERI